MKLAPLPPMPFPAWPPAETYPAPESPEHLLELIRDPQWRLCSGHIYKITVKTDEDDPHAPGLTKPFHPNEAQRQFFANIWYRNVILKPRQLGFCLEASTRVLTADLRWVRIDSLKPGDEVVATDEKVPGGRGSGRRMRTAVIEATETVRRIGCRITFADGRSVVCSDQHPWLARSGPLRKPFWRAMDKKAPNAERALTVGCQVRSICTPWDDPAYEDGWFGGIIDSEGSIAKKAKSGAQISVAQRPGDVWDRMVAYAKSRGYSARIESDAAEPLNKYGKVSVPKLCFTRMYELFRLIGQTRPSRMIHNRFWENKELPGTRNADSRAWNEIIGIEQIGMLDMIDLQTSTGTYIAEGMVSHNTTAGCIMALDSALFTPTFNSVVIAHTLVDAQEIFRSKIAFAYSRLPDALQGLFPLRRKTTTHYEFEHNNSTIRVASGARSGTTHYLHVSEMGKIAARMPIKAAEIMSGSLESVPLDGIVTLESTAEGQSGIFYETSQLAQANRENRTPLNTQQFRFHFYAWFENSEYRMDPRNVLIAPQDHEYFDKVEDRMETTITLHQRAWYVAKRDANYAGNKETMWREYPSTPEECWQASTEGKYLAEQLQQARAQGRIGSFPLNKHIPVNTFWDLGATDDTVIWLHQRVDSWDRWVGYYQQSGKGYLPAVLWIEEQGCVLGEHFLPHDAHQQRQQAERVASPLTMLQEMRPQWKFHVVPRVSDIQHGIDLLRADFATYQFDAEACAVGLEHLAAYTRSWNSKLGVWGVQPLEDGHEHAPDALRQKAQGYSSILRPAPGSTPPNTKKGRRRASSMTA